MKGNIMPVLTGTGFRKKSKDRESGESEIRKDRRDIRQTV